LPKCIVCGNEFEAVTDKKYCSKKCRQAHYRQVHREQIRKYGRSYSRDYYKKHTLKRNQESKDYYQKNAEKLKLLIKKYRQKLKLEIFTHYGGNPPKCACCGETIIDFLSIDHINNDGAKHRKEEGLGYQFYRWLKNNNFPEGYQVLCMNCQFGKRINNGICSHKLVRENGHQ
jgi:hypothetical protein